MRHTIAEIAAALGAEAAGETGLTVTGAAEPSAAGPEDLALAMDPRYAPGLARGQARAAMLWPGADWRGLGLRAVIFAPRGRLALAGLTRMLDPGPMIAPGIHPMTVIDPSARIGPGAALGPFVSIAAGVEIGARARIASHVSIAEGARIGDDALIHAGARIGPRVLIGHRLICLPGAVIGADGLSFVTPEKSGVEAVRETLGARHEAPAQGWVRIHSLGSVEIGDDVEVGANSCIDRGTIRNTRVGPGTKIDNLVHLAHNVVVGRDCLFAALVGIAGSTTVGDRVVLGGQVGVSDNLFIGNDVVAGGATVILSNVPAGRAILGYPAVPMDTAIAQHKALRRLARPAKKAVPKPGGND